MYQYICSKCGGHLDPGEKCDCEEEKKKQEEENKKNNDDNTGGNTGDNSGVDDIFANFRDLF